MVAFVENPAPEDMDPTLAAERVWYEQDLYLFAKEVLGLDRLTKHLHRDIVTKFCTDVWDQPQVYSVLMLPRQCFKTTLANIAFTIWDILRNPNLRILLASSKKGLAVRIMREIKMHLQNPKILELWPDVVWEKPKTQSELWLSEEINVKRTYHDKVPSISVGSVEGGVTGNHYHKVVLDDLVDRDNHKTSGGREDVKDFVRECENLLRRPDEWCPPGGRVLDIGTPWHFDDAHAMIRNDSGYKLQLRELVMGIYGTPGKTDGTWKDIIFGEEFDQKLIFRKVTAMGRRVANAQMYCDPRPDAQAIFSEKNFRWYDVGKEPQNLEVYTAIDPNRSEKTKNDPIAVVTAGKDKDGEIWILDYTGGHPVGEEMLQIIEAHVTRWNPVAVFCEDTNYQNQIQHFARSYFIQRGLHINFVPVTRGHTRKFDRITALCPLVESGGMHFPRNEFGSAASEEMKLYEGKHDDILDALADIFAYGNPARDDSIVEHNAPTHAGLMQSMMSDMGMQLQAAGGSGDMFHTEGVTW